MTDAIADATSSGAWIGTPGGGTGEPPRAFLPKSVDTMPGRTSDTFTLGCDARRSIRRFEVRMLSAAFEALYAERKEAIGKRPSIDDTLMTCPVPRSWKCGTIACIP